MVSRVLQSCRIAFGFFIAILFVWHASQGLSIGGLKDSSPRRAWVTFLNEYIPDQPETAPKEDLYFENTRILAYQLLHDPVLRTDLPFLVVVTPDVSAKKRDQLTKDGATVIEADKIELPFGAEYRHRWRDVLTKLRLFQLTSYDTICFLDADTLLQAPILGVFDDPAATVSLTGTNETEILPDEAPLPPDYLLASKSEPSGHLDTDHEHPEDLFGAGFMVLKPSQESFEYYESLLPLVATPGREGRWWYANPEQNLWAYAHRRGGNLPWTELAWDWNVHVPKAQDLGPGGAKSFHGRMWLPEFDVEIQEWWAGWRAEMERFYAARSRHWWDGLKTRTNL